ncbi:hypothetical protein BVX95_00825 [archaeon D22]|nr:hypothetical protein BVX95_00825 [archaeon D22]
MVAKKGRKSIEDTVDLAQAENELDLKLRSINGGYDPANYSVGRYMTMIAHPEVFDVEFSGIELKIMGRRVMEEVNKDFNECVFPALNDLLKVRYGTSLPILHRTIDGEFNPSYVTDRGESITDAIPGITHIQTEFDILKYLVDNIPDELLPPDHKKGDQVDLNKLPLSDIAIERMKEVQNTPHKVSDTVDVLIMNFDSLKKGNLAHKKLPFHFMSTRNKLGLALVKKFLHRDSRIYNMSDADFLGMDINSDMGVKSGLKKQDIIDYHNSYIAALFRQGTDIYDAHYSWSSFHHYEGRRIGGVFNDRVADKFFSDSSGFKGILSEDALKKLKGRLEKDLGSILRILPSRTYDTFSTGEKDRAVVYGFEGSDKATYGEMRVQALIDMYEGEFGEHSHFFVYKPDQKSELKKGLRKSKELRNARDNLCIAFEVSARDI